MTPPRPFDYRVAVEAVIRDGDRVLLVLRSHAATIAPGKWNVPAGKVKFTEIPSDAVLRECQEETALPVRLLGEIGVRAFHDPAPDRDIYRLVYTYLFETLAPDSPPTLNDEHEQHAWATRAEIVAGDFPGLSTALRDLILTHALPSTPAPQENP